MTPIIIWKPFSKYFPTFSSLRGSFNCFANVSKTKVVVWILYPSREKKEKERTSGISSRAICMSPSQHARLTVVHASTLMKLTQRQIGRSRRLDPRQGVVEAAAAVHRVLGILVLVLLRLSVHALAFDPHVLRVFVVPRVQLGRTSPDPLPGLFPVTLGWGRGCEENTSLWWWQWWWLEWWVEGCDEYWIIFFVCARLNNYREIDY